MGHLWIENAGIRDLQLKCGFLRVDAFVSDKLRIY